MDIFPFNHLKSANQQAKTLLIRWFRRWI